MVTTKWVLEYKDRKGYTCETAGARKSAGTILVP